MQKVGVSKQNSACKQVQKELFLTKRERSQFGAAKTEAITRTTSCTKTILCHDDDDGNDDHMRQQVTTRSSSMVRNDGMRRRRPGRFFSFSAAATMAIFCMAISMTAAFAVTFSRKYFFSRLKAKTKQTMTCSFDDNDDNKQENIPGCDKIREALCTEFPEIETVYSDAYLESVASVPNRTIDHAIGKIRRTLKWRRLYNVETLLQAFEAVDHNTTGRIFVPNVKFDEFDPTLQLVEVCASGAFSLLEKELFLENGDRRLLILADTSKLNWWKTGVKAGLRYHVLVLEDAWTRITLKNKDCSTKKQRLEQSLILCVDTTAPPLLPPPLGALRGMVRLLQTAYPDRIYRVCVGPVSPLVRGLYTRGVKPFLKPKMRQKIHLLGEAPSPEVLSKLMITS